MHCHEIMKRKREKNRSEFNIFRGNFNQHTHNIIFLSTYVSDTIFRINIYVLSITYIRIYNPIHILSYRIYYELNKHKIHDQLRVTKSYNVVFSLIHATHDTINERNVLNALYTSRILHFPWLWSA